MGAFFIYNTYISTVCRNKKRMCSISFSSKWLGGALLIGLEIFKARTLGGTQKIV